MLHFHFRYMMITIQLCDKLTTCISLSLQLAGPQTCLTMNHNLILPHLSLHINWDGTWWMTTRHYTLVEAERDESRLPQFVRFFIKKEALKWQLKTFNLEKINRQTRSKQQIVWLKNRSFSRKTMKWRCKKHHFVGQHVCSCPPKACRLEDKSYAIGDKKPKKQLSKASLFS